MEPTELPPLWALDDAARRAGYTDWAEVARMHGGRVSGAYASVEAHARTLAKYEPEPVDPAELKRRQDAREAAVVIYSQAGVSGDGLKETRRGDDDAEGCVQSAYIALCHRDGTTPVPVEEWGK